MRELQVVLAQVHPGALDTALKTALGTKCHGLSTYGPDRPVSIWLDDSAVQADLDTATALAVAHDPVFLAANKLTMKADGSDSVTIIVRAPKPGTAAVTLIVNGGDEWPITLTDGTGQDTLTALDPGMITVVVKNPANRSTDVLRIEAL